MQRDCLARLWRDYEQRDCLARLWRRYYVQRDCLARLWRDIMCRGTAWRGCGGDITCSRGRWGFLVEKEFRVEVEDGLVCGVVMM